MNCLGQRQSTRHVYISTSHNLCIVVEKVECFKVVVFLSLLSWLMHKNTHTNTVSSESEYFLRKGGKTMWLQASPQLPTRSSPLDDKRLSSIRQAAQPSDWQQPQQPLADGTSLASWNTTAFWSDMNIGSPLHHLKQWDTKTTTSEPMTTAISRTGLEPTHTVRCPSMRPQAL